MKFPDEALAAAWGEEFAMIHERSPDGRDATLPYAGGVAGEVRESLLATLSLVFAVVWSPWLVLPLLDRIDPSARLPHGLTAVVVLLPIALAVVAIVRIHRSRGRRTGLGWAFSALVVSVVHLGLSLLLSFAVGGDLGPGD